MGDGTRNIEVAEADPLSPEAMELLEASDRDLLERYAPGNIYTVSPSEAAGPGAVFLIARIGGVAVGCGAVVPLDDDVAEINRMFVKVEARGKGVGRSLLAGLEAAATKLGFGTLRLETGRRQPEAIRLYESSGYEQIARYGEYAADPHSVCFEKILR